MKDAKTAILVTSFGTSYNDSRKAAIEALEKTIADAYPLWEVRRAFTSGMIIEKLARRDGVRIDNVAEALERLATQGVERLYIQPTHVMNGNEYEEVAREAEAFRKRFKSIALGSPLLTASNDYEEVVRVLAEEYAPAPDQALVFMGHGTGHYADAAYAALDYRFKARGHKNIFVGTVEGYPALEDVMGFLEEGNFRKVMLAPLMVVAGDHALNDMAGDEEDSWKSVLTQKGYEVECRLKGLGEIPAIRDIYAAHLRTAIEGTEGQE